MGNKVSLEEELINLRITSKQMGRSAKKCEKNEKAALDKLKKVRQKVLCSCYYGLSASHCLLFV
jgi:charged multivesicular body protein 1